MRTSDTISNTTNRPSTRRVSAAPIAILAAALACAVPAHAERPAERPAERAGQRTIDVDLVLDIEVGEPVMLAGSEQTAYVKIALTGASLPAASRRAPINLALVLDRSSSMSGDRIARAREAALMVVDRLQDDDIVSVITFDSTVEVLVPATRAKNRDQIRKRIASITPRGMTALFAGVSFGIEEVTKHLDSERVNRIILLSDGQANVGPTSPNELGRLGVAAAGAGISITTIGLGLGYNEDLMTQLALSSDGNHAFAQHGADLPRIFQHELGDLLSVVAQNIEIEVNFDAGVKPIRSLNRDARIYGNKAVLSLNQLYAAQQRHYLLEVAVPAGAAGTRRDLARVDVRYANMLTKKPARASGAAAIAFTPSRATVTKRQNREVLAAAVEAIADERSRAAVALRDEGKVKEAERALQQNAAYLAREGERLGSTRLKQHSQQNARDAKNLDEDKWMESRKQMRENQHRNQTQQAW